MLASVVKSFSLLSRKRKLTFLVLLLVRTLLHALDVAAIAAAGFLGTVLVSGIDIRERLGFLPSWIATETEDLFFYGVLLVAVLFILKSTFSGISMRLTTRFLAKVEAEAAIQVVGTLFSQGLRDISRYSSGEIQWAAGYSSTVAFSTVLFSASSIITETALFMMLFVVFSVLDLATTVLLGAYFGFIFMIFQLGIHKRLQRLGKRLEENSVAINNSVLDLVNAFREISVLNQTGSFVAKFGSARSIFAKDQGLQRFLFGFPRYFVEIFLMAGVLCLISWQYLTDKLPEGLVGVGIFLIGGLRMMAALLPIQNALIELKTAAPQAKRAHDIISSAREHHVSSLSIPREARPSRKNPSGALRVTVSNVSFETDELAILRAVSLAIEPGTHVAIVGESGAGKSTLLDIMLGLLEPSSGQVRIEGEAPKDFQSAYPGLISYLPQNSALVSGSIAQNIALGARPSEIDEGRVWELLNSLELEKLAARVPGGIHGTLGKQNSELSGGQKQRIGLARALYTNPRLLLMDEATSALDSRTESLVTELVSNLRDRCTVVTVAHRLSTIRNSDVVYLMSNGSVEAYGAFEELLAQSATFREQAKRLQIDPKAT